LNRQTGEVGATVRAFGKAERGNIVRVPGTEGRSHPVVVRCQVHCMYHAISRDMDPTAKREGRHDPVVRGVRRSIGSRAWQGLRFLARALLAAGCRDCVKFDAWEGKVDALLNKVAAMSEKRPASPSLPLAQWEAFQKGISAFVPFDDAIEALKSLEIPPSQYNAFRHVLDEDLGVLDLDPIQPAALRRLRPLPPDWTEWLIIRCRSHGDKWELFWSCPSANDWLAIPLARALAAARSASCGEYKARMMALSSWQNRARNLLDASPPALDAMAMARAVGLAASRDLGAVVAQALAALDGG
jgi:hypothetical protein